MNAIFASCHKARQSSYYQFFRCIATRANALLWIGVSSPQFLCYFILGYCNTSSLLRSSSGILIFNISLMDFERYDCISEEMPGRVLH